MARAADQGASGAAPAAPAAARPAARRGAPPDDALNVALERLRRLMGSRSVFARQAEAAAVDLPQQAVQVLATLAGQPPRAVAEVARAARMDVGAVSRQLRILEDAGLASRRASPTNGTVVLTAATRAGEELAGRFRQVGSLQLERALAGWSQPDREQLGRLMLRFVDDLVRTPYEPG
jgi:DNA-binding MarR family transcriptional regulator